MGRCSGFNRVALPSSCMLQTVMIPHSVDLWVAQKGGLLLNVLYLIPPSPPPPPARPTYVHFRLRPPTCLGPRTCASARQSPMTSQRRRPRPTCATPRAAWPAADPRPASRRCSRRGVRGGRASPKGSPPRSGLRAAPITARRGRSNARCVESHARGDRRAEVVYGRTCKCRSECAPKPTTRNSAGARGWVGVR